MKKLTVVGLALLAILSCKKESSEVKSEITSVYFYRLGIENADGSVSITNVVPVRISKESLGTGNNPGTGNGGNGQGQSHHFNGDTCNPNIARFCEKHPWHQKCNNVLLPLKLDYFNVGVNDNKPVIVWKALIESDISRYFIQRSENAKDFGNVGIVLPKGPMNEYKYTDNP